MGSDNRTPSDLSLGYDETPYPSAPYPYSHCDHLAIVARLFGIPAAHVEHCSALEVGCADGANLIPMSLTLPGSQFTGIDLSARQIASGQDVIARLGLTNITLQRQDLAELPTTARQFDYIIAHGVYSWTSYEVQGRLLDLVRDCLAPHGVAFISYNVYPGWQRQKAVREWLLQATRSADSTTARLESARGLLSGLRKRLDSRRSESEREVAEMLTRLETWNDGYLRHDLLEDHNEPQFFASFVERVEAHGLRFFAEADVASMTGAELPAGLAKDLSRFGGSLVQREQLLDLFTQRAFRQSLLCRADSLVGEQIDASVVRSAYVVSTLRARSDSSQPAAHRLSQAARFESHGGFAVEVADLAVAQALARLQNAWPRGAWFEELIVAAPRSDSGAGAASPDRAEFERQQQLLANVLVAGFVERAVELHSIAPAGAPAVSQRPLASPLARLQAILGSMVTSLRHDIVRLEPLARALIVHLDGSHDRDQLQRMVLAPGSNPAENVDIDAILRDLLRVGLLLS